MNGFAGGWLKLLFVVRRENYNQPGDNGIGMQMLCLDKGVPALQRMTFIF